MVTTTSYGTWLPGDLRGYVQEGLVLPANPALLNHAKQMLKKAPVFFTPAQQERLFSAIVAACIEFRYSLEHLSIEQWHLHWVVGHGFDPIETIVGRLKNRMRQALKIGRIWTEGYCARPLYSDVEIQICAEYIARHEGNRVIHRGADVAHGIRTCPPAKPGAHG